jgi:predicted O-methyltransferase YrrM
MEAAPLKILSEKTDDGDYVPSYEVGGSDLGERHRDTVAAVQDIPGWLRREDILKLYELAYFSPGPILEIGCYHGKSTVVMARALADRATAVPLVSVDVDPVALRAAGQATRDHDLADRVLFVRGSVRACARAIPDLRPMMVFLDGDHSLRGVRRDLAVLRRAVPDGAVLLFHDYHDAGNADPANTDLGVVEAVRESWVATECEFGGVFGCCALFVRRRGGPAAPPTGRPASLMLELIARDSLPMQYRQRVRWPLGRRLRAAQRRLR